MTLNETPSTDTPATPQLTETKPRKKPGRVPKPPKPKDDPYKSGMTVEQYHAAIRAQRRAQLEDIEKQMAYYEENLKPGNKEIAALEKKIQDLKDMMVFSEVRLQDLQLQRAQLQMLLGTAKH